MYFIKLTEPSLKEVPKTSCKDVPDKVCKESFIKHLFPPSLIEYLPQTVAKEECFNQPKESCKTVTKSQCTTVPETECRKVARQSCSLVPRQTCRSVPVQECQQVPREVSCLSVSMLIFCLEYLSVCRNARMYRKKSVLQCLQRSADLSPGNL